MRLAELTWSEVEALKARAPFVLLPVGATEAHGPHLPLGTDVFLSEELAVRVARALEDAGKAALIAPPLSYSVAEYAANFCGTVSLSPATAIALLIDVITALNRIGRVVIINNHLDPAHADTLRTAVAQIETQNAGTKIAFPDQLTRRWARTLSDEYKRASCHAGQYETSLVLAARPELVRAAHTALTPVPIDLARAMKEGKRTFEEAGATDAYFGDPAAASVAHGDEQYGLLMQMVLTTIAETWQ